MARIDGQKVLGRSGGVIGKHASPSLGDPMREGIMDERQAGLRANSPEVKAALGNVNANALKAVGEIAGKKSADAEEGLALVATDAQFENVALNAVEALIKRWKTNAEIEKVEIKQLTQDERERYNSYRTVENRGMCIKLLNNYRLMKIARATKYGNVAEAAAAAIDLGAVDAYSDRHGGISMGEYTIACIQAIPHEEARQRLNLKLMARMTA
jgi:hypothetical protein